MLMKWTVAVSMLSAIPTVAFAQGTANLPVPPSGFDQRRSRAAQGTLTSITYQSSSYGARAARIYTPPGYSTATKYPTLYLLHGLNQTETDTSTHFTYSEEQPNSLLVEEVPLFLGGIRRLYPQHFGMVALGFATGLRPSSLRPLRRQGPEADVRWEEGVVLVRRSHTRHDEVMEATKRKTRYRITCPTN